MSDHSTPADNYQSAASHFSQHASHRVVLRRAPIPTGRTVEERKQEFLRDDGTRDLRVRELARGMHVGAERLPLVLSEPERLSLNSLFGLAQLMGLTHAQLIADVFHQVTIRHQQGLIKPLVCRTQSKSGRPQGRRAKGSSDDRKAGDA